MTIAPLTSDERLGGALRLLLAEDDARLADVLRRCLAERGYLVDLFVDGAAALQAALYGAYDAIVLDVTLPSMNGFEVARTLRTAGSDAAIVMATARDTTEEVIAGLDAGADDYLVKPFDLAELEARLRSVARRRVRVASAVLRRYGIVLDADSLRVTRGNRVVSLTAREAAFLSYFMRNAGIVLTRRMIEDALWDEHRDSGASNIIDVYVGRLRAKLTVAGEAPVLHTVRGAGYRFALDA